ncbi:class D sortase [Porcipelethomonas sp.]|uniref:class D sortase n=1 Tax=Porcipelethomonas sp. TaxID=2981675 RepID=UPI003EF5BF7A
MSYTKKRRNLGMLLITPAVIFAICSGAIAGAGYMPVKKLKAAADIIFSANSGHEQINEIKYLEKETESQLDDGSKIVYPSFGSQYATLKIDSIDLEAPVYWGSSDELLDQGVCQYTGSVFIGEKGNVVLDAHCNTFFLNLGDVKEGDIIVLTTSYGEFTYKAKESTIFKDTNNAFIAPTTDDRLTLYTCYGNLLGPTEDRLAVICELVEKKFYE